MRKFLVVALVIVVFFIGAVGQVKAHTFAVVTNQLNDDLGKATVLDLCVEPPVQVAEIPGLGQSFDVAITPDGSRALVTSGFSSNSSNDTVYVIDLTASTPTVLYNITVGKEPVGVSIGPNGAIAVVCNNFSSTISIINLTVDPPVVTSTVPLSGITPYDAIITGDAMYAIVVGIANFNEASVVDLTLPIPAEIVSAKIGVGDFSVGIGVNPDRTIAVVTSIGDNSATVLDLTTFPFSIKGILSVGNNPGSKPDISQNGLAVVPNSGDSTVSIIDVAGVTPTVVATLPVGNGPRGAAIIDRDNVALIANRADGSISRLNLNDFTFLSTLSGITSANHISIHEDNVFSNTSPTANAGPDQSVFVGDTVILDGSNSSDVDGDSLTFQWALTSMPLGSTATLTNPTTVNPTFVVDLPGSYVAQLIVNDGAVNSVPDTVTISTLNSAPVANAGPDQTPFVGDTVTLDGSGSSDVDGNPLTYQWSLTSVPVGSTATLTNPTTVNPTFVVDLPGSYVAQLKVNDGAVNSVPDTVTISTLNSAPVANAGPDQTPFVGDTVTLDGSGSSDVDGDLLTYQWSLTSVPAGSTATLSDIAAVSPSFIIDVFGTYVAQLIVNDGTVDSAPDTVNVSTLNSAPVADAGSDQSVHPGDLVTLDGINSSDADGDSLTYSWAFTSVPSGSTATLDDLTLVNPTFTADVPGTYVVSLVVNDGTVDSDPDTVTISTVNVAPIADAGPDQSVTVIGTTVQLDGSQSWDADGDPITYQWTFVSKPAGSTTSLTGANTDMPTFVADVHDDYVVQLVVSDPWTQGLPDTVIVSFENLAPVADAGLSQSVVVGDTVTIDGSGSSDANDDILTYSWSLSAVPTGSVSSIANPTFVTASFVPDSAGTYVVQLIVNDGFVDSDPSTIQVEAVPADLQTAAILSVQSTETVVQSLGSDPNVPIEDVLKNPKMQNTLLNKLNAVIANIEAGNYADALGQLQNDILKKTDGCANTGAPDKNDWVKDCASQAIIYQAVLDAIAEVGALL